MPGGEGLMTTFHAALAYGGGVMAAAGIGNFLPVLLSEGLGYTTLRA